ncbi:hypothetical protein [Fictibacillus sp. UD]|uniref:hypothetical protein n=1 Tax=Fictibacillus sp. UD TaxID=3038777 RepID=UPI003747CF22
MGDSCGTGRQVRHLYVKRTNVAHRLPRGKRAPGTEINHFQKHYNLSKKIYRGETRWQMKFECVMHQVQQDTYI